MSIPTSQIGQTTATVTQLGFGGAPLGELFEQVSAERSQSILEAAWNGGIRYYDTAPFYGHGLSEHRVGHMVREQPRDDFVLSTKVGRVLSATKDLSSWKSPMWAGGLPFEITFDYSYDGIMRSYEDSLQRLGLNRVDLLLIHDLDFWFNETEERVAAYLNQLYTSGWRALDELKSTGCIKGIGAGINETGMIPRFFNYVPVDFFICAMPYNLLDQETLEVEFPLCEKHGAGIVIGAAFASGILATGPVEGAYYRYEPATPEVLDRTGMIQKVCESHGVPLGAAALQFPLHHPVVNATIPGALEPEHVQTNVGWFTHDIPSSLWADLKSEKLIREDAPTP